MVSIPGSRAETALPGTELDDIDQFSAKQSYYHYEKAKEDVYADYTMEAIFAQQEAMKKAQAELEHQKSLLRQQNIDHGDNYMGVHTVDGPITTDRVLSKLRWDDNQVAANNQKIAALDGQSSGIGNPASLMDNYGNCLEMHNQNEKVRPVVAQLSAQIRTDFIAKKWKQTLDDLEKAGIEAAKMKHVGGCPPDSPGDLAVYADIMRAEKDPNAKPTARSSSSSSESFGSSADGLIHIRSLLHLAPASDQAGRDRALWAYLAEIPLSGMIYSQYAWRLYEELDLILSQLGGKSLTKGSVSGRSSAIYDERESYYFENDFFKQFHALLNKDQNYWRLCETATKAGKYKLVDERSPILKRLETEHHSKSNPPPYTHEHLFEFLTCYDQAAGDIDHALEDYSEYFNVYSNNMQDWRTHEVTTFADLMTRDAKALEDRSKKKMPISSHHWLLAKEDFEKRKKVQEHEELRKQPGMDF